MTEDEIIKKLQDKGCPRFVWQSGSKGLIKLWEDFVNEVERGYCPSCLLEEYYNDLDTRDLIRLVGLDDRVKNLDQRFITLLTRRDLRMRKSNLADDFWNYGYPKNASGFFLEEIKRYIKSSMC